MKPRIMQRRGAAGRILISHGATPTGDLQLANGSRRSPEQQGCNRVNGRLMGYRSFVGVKRTRPRRRALRRPLGQLYRARGTMSRCSMINAMLSVSDL